MGFFSFITSDTNQSIPNIHSSRKTFPVYLVTPGPSRQVFEEKEYDGYGVFGSKDIYLLIAELNNILPNNTKEDRRSAVLNLMFRTIVTNGKGISYEKGIDFNRWNEPLGDTKRTANELVYEDGWSIIYPNGYGDFNEAARQGYIMPKLFEDRASINHWDEFPYPTSCSYQGYFYEDFKLISDE